MSDRVRMINRSDEVLSPVGGVTITPRANKVVLRRVAENAQREFPEAIEIRELREKVVRNDTDRPIGIPGGQWVQPGGTAVLDEEAYRKRDAGLVRVFDS